MNKIFRFCLLFAVGLSGIATAGAAVFRDQGFNFKVLSEDDKTVELVAIPGEPYSGDVKVPSSATNEDATYSVVGIGSRTFYACTDMTSVDIPASVTSIGEAAFKGCSTLTEIVIPESITEISPETFAGCSGLTSVSFPSGLKKVGNLAFDSCDRITTLTLPDALTDICNAAFIFCAGLTKIEFGTGLKTIEDNAFAKCKSLTEVVLPASVTSIAGNAFSSCTGMKSIGVDAGNTVFTSYEGVLYSKDMTKLMLAPYAITRVNIPDETTAIYPYSFNGSLIEEVEGMKNVETIGDFAFSECMNLSKVTLSNKLRVLGEEAFSSTRIDKINLPESLTKIGNYAFNRCLLLTSVEVPSEVTEIGNYCFFGCKALKTIVIGKSVNWIGEYAFHDCTALEKIYSKPVVPPFCASEFTDEQYAHTVLYVPQESLQAYRQADQWEHFTSIEPDKTTGLQGVASEELRVSVRGTVITVEGDFISAAVYRTDGSVAGVADGGTLDVCHGGCYLVNVRTADGEKTFKVMATH